MISQTRAEKIMKPGRYPVDDNLFLRVKESGAKSWVFRYQSNKKDRSLGLGPFPLVSVLEAKEKALEARKNIFQGLDPIDQKKELAAEKARAAAGTKTFREAAIAYGEMTSVKWTRKVADEFHQRMSNYVYPALGSVAVNSVDRAKILNCLTPIWTSKYSTAKNVRRDIARVLAFAKGHGWRSGDDPTEFVDDVLPNLDHKAGLREALPYSEMFAFMKKLSAIEGTAARGAEFCILTAVRKTEAQEARWSEIDFDNKRWNIPKERMKGGRKAHSVPLSPRALEILKGLPREEGNEFVFMGERAGQSVGDISKLIKRINLEIDLHGFRSSFSDWAHEKAIAPNHVIEMALAHTIKNKVERAYRRGDLFEQRVPLMTAWANYCYARPVVGGATVTPIRAAG